MSFPFHINTTRDDHIEEHELLTSGEQAKHPRQHEYEVSPVSTPRKSSVETRRSPPDYHPIQNHKMPPMMTKKSLKDRLGAYTIITNLLGLAGLAVSVSVITWMWFGNNQQDLLKNLFLNDLLSQAVTLCSVLIRLASAAQATLIVALLAAVVLESRTLGGVRLKDAPGMSIARYSNSGPACALPIFWNGLPTPFTWPVALLAVMAFFTIASQFTSTLLLWDIEPAPLLNQFQIETGVGFRYDTWVDNNMTTLAFQGRNYWTAPLSAAPAFAEWSQPPNNTEGNASLTDTGPSLRAFIPINNAETRSQMLAFEGSATVFDSRVVCTRPKLNLTHIRYDWRGFKFIEGTFRHEEFPEEVRQILKLSNATETAFNLSLADTMPGSLLFVELGTNHGGLLNSLDPLANITSHVYQRYDEANQWAGSYGRVINETQKPVKRGSLWPVELGHAFFVIHRPEKATERTEESVTVDASVNGTYKILEDGVWAEFGWNSAPGRMTVCYDAHYAQCNRSPLRIKHHQNFPVRATRQLPSSEAAAAWDRDALSFNVSSISRAYQNSSAIRSRLFNLERATIDDSLRRLRASWDPKSLALVSMKSRGTRSTQDEARGGETGREMWFPLSNSSELEDHTEYGQPQIWWPTAFVNISEAEQTTFSKREMHDFINSLIWSPFRQPFTYYDWWESQSRNPLIAGFQILTVCKACDVLTGRRLMENTTILNPTLGGIAWDVFEATDGNPAKTWQALTTAVISSAYHDWLPTFATNETISTTHYVQRSQPRRYRGYAIAMAIIMGHLLVTCLALVIFHKSTELSLIDSSWQAVSQLIAPETYDVLINTTTVRDSAVSAMIQAEDMSNENSVAKSTGSQTKQGIAKSRICLQRYEGGTIGVARYREDVVR